MWHFKTLFFKSILCLLCAVPAFAWQTKLEKKLAALEKHPQEDRKRVDLLCSIAYNYYKKDPEKTESYAKQGLKLANKLNYVYGVAKAYRYLGLSYRTRNDYGQALHYFRRAIKQAHKIKDTLVEARVYASIGLLYRSQAAHKRALEYMFRSLKLSEKLQDSAGIATTCNNMGVVYASQKNYELALQYYQRSLKMKRALGRKRSVASTIHNIGNIHRVQGKYDLAMKHSLEAAKIKEGVGNQYGLANSYGQIGNIYEDQGKYDLAIGYYRKALDICYQVKRPSGVAESETNLGRVYTLMEQFGVAKNHLDKGLIVAQQIDAHDLVVDAYLGLTDWFKAQRDFEQAFVYHQKYTTLKDSLYNNQKSRQVAEMQVLYETEKKDLDNQALKDEKARQKAVIKQQRIITLLVVVALVVSIVLAYNLFRQRQQKQKVNELLKQKNEEIFTTNDILAELNVRLETKNKDITASIKYAQHIQKAIFPSEGKLQQMFAHSFVYFNPLEVVSGDFYWLAELNAEQTGSFDKKVLAVVDCTGHGVPGAFMSMIATVLLKEIVHLQYVHAPDSILNEMHRKIRRTLKQNQNYNRDGMEIGIIVLEPEAHTLEFAGARRPLLYIQNQQVYTIRGDRLPIGGEQREQERRFTKHTLYLRDPLTLYLFSDGYQDQFGGAHNKKMGSKKLSQLLEEIHHLPMPKQQQLLEERFEQWKGENPQTDDVMVCGVKLGE